MKIKSLVVIFIVVMACVLISFGGRPWAVVGDIVDPNKVSSSKPALASSQVQSEGYVAPDDDQEGERKIVDYEADRIYKASGDSAIRLVGNVLFHHNGAIIQCDSAYRYDDRRMDCFGKVIINKDSTYIYGDMAVYDGNVNTAKVYAPIVKLLRGDATLYTYNLTFDTKTSIATYVGGGVMFQRDNVMESQNGVYDGNLSNVKFLGDVAMRNDNYLIKTDSASYNMNVEKLIFLDRTYIWDSERDFLTANTGDYLRSTEAYTFTSDAYAMTPDQQMWADTMRYYTQTKEAYMFGNVQILDSTQNTLAFGDYGYYNDSLKNAILTRTPSVLNYEQDGDTMFMRADSIFLYTFQPGMSRAEPEPEASASTNAKSLSEVDSLRRVDSLSSMQLSDSLGTLDSLALDSLGTLASDSTALRDSLGTLDSLALDSLSADSIVATADKIDKIALPKSEKQLLREQKMAEKAVRKAEKKAIAAEKRKKRAAWLLGDVGVDSVSSANSADSSAIADSLQLADSLLSVDSLRRVDSVAVGDSLGVVTDTTDRDSLERVIRAYSNVRIYRVDAQAVADSMVGFSVDSIINLFGRPILWSEKSQVTADQIDIYMRNDELDWADFVGSPFITQEVDTSKYNQASGKQMQAYFKDNAIDYTDLEGNVMNYYYMEDEDSVVVAFATVICAQMTMYFANQEPDKLNWQGQPEWVIYPIEQIPADQPQRLDGFTWSPELRPKDRYEICSRTIRPTQRKESNAITKPQFYIEKRFISFRDDLISRGVWSDRTDIPLVTADYFITRNLVY